MDLGVTHCDKAEEGEHGCRKGAPVFLVPGLIRLVSEEVYPTYSKQVHEK